MDPAFSGVKVENVPVSLDVPWTSREVECDERYQEEDTQPTEIKGLGKRKLPWRYDDYYVFH